jgi:hypothetical protein
MKNTTDVSYIDFLINNMNIESTHQISSVYFDSFIVEDTFLNEKKPLRLLEVDKRLILSAKSPTHFGISSNDVIHS